MYLGLESTAALACTSKGWRESCDEMRSFCVQLIDVELRNFCGLAKFYPHLRYLDLKPSRHKKTLRVVDAKAMVKSCPLVESLDLGGYLLSDAALTTLVSHLKKLAQLGLRVWYNPTLTPTPTLPYPYAYPYPYPYPYPCPYPYPYPNPNQVRPQVQADERGRPRHRRAQLLSQVA